MRWFRRKLDAASSDEVERERRERERETEELRRRIERIQASLRVLRANESREGE